jgi:hypothetical protein
MVRIQLNLSHLTWPQKIDKASKIVKALTGNADFPTPIPEMVSETTAINEFDSAVAAQASRQEAKTKTTDQNNKEAIDDGLLMQLRSYVDSVADSDQKKILKRGFKYESAERSHHGAIRHQDRTMTATHPSVGRSCPAHVRI